MDLRLDLKHEIVQDIKRVAAELGHRPTRDEYKQSCKIVYRRLIETFGSFSVAIQAAGLAEAIKDERLEAKRRVSEFFITEVSELRKNANDKMLQARGKEFPSVLIAPDIHTPWHSAAGIDMFYKIAKKMQPDHIVQLGDFYDMFSFASFPRSYLVIKPDDEIKEAYAFFTSFWSTLKKLCPRSKLHQLRGNHSARPMKRLLEKCPELEVFFNFNYLFEHEGVNTHHDTREPLIIDDVAFIHGFLSGNGKHRAKIPMHLVHGHTHDMYLRWDKLQHNKMLFEMGCGLLGDPGAKIFNYTAVKEIKWQLGCAAILPSGPILIPFD